MKITLFGATGALGSELLHQSLALGHEVTVLVRAPDKLPTDLRPRIDVVEGDALNSDDVGRALASDPDVVLFAIGVDRQSPPDLCTDVTRLILERGVRRFIWCGGGSTLLDDDVMSFGARFVQLFSKLFMSLRHNDKTHQWALLQQYPDTAWLGVRPLQMKAGPHTKIYRLGYDAFSGMSSISFADCADAMLGMLDDDTWLRRAPIVQY